jgi:hypothetical protein
LVVDVFDVNDVVMLEVWVPLVGDAVVVFVIVEVLV